MPFLLLVFFIYGLAFFALGIAVALESGRSPLLVEARVMQPLAFFGLLHGVHEWLDSYLMQAAVFGMPLPVWLPIFRLGLLTASFGFLLDYGVRSLRAYPPEKPLRIFLPLGLYTLTISLSALWTILPGPSNWASLLDGLVRYLLAVPAALLAALALHRQGNAAPPDQPRLAIYLQLASVAFLVYALTQMVIQPGELFPANVINTMTFRMLSGFPIQVVRAVAASLVAFGVLHSLRQIERKRQEQLLAAEHARLEALEQQQALRRNLLDHLVRAQEEERARIARELHDETAQTLSAFSIELAILDPVAGKDTQVASVVERLRTLCRQASQGLHRLVHDLRPAQLDDLGLVAALEYLVEQHERDGLRVHMVVEGPHRVDAQVETAFFRVAQEALTNIVRHAKAAGADLRLTFDGDQAVLTVADHGCGFDPAQTFSPPRGWGLAGMRERVEALGGRLLIQSSPGHGTTIEAVLPLTPPALDVKDTGI